jgi:hypothetical protein
MNKKQNGSAILAGIAITAILVASTLIAGNQFAQQAHAQNTTRPSTPSTTTTSPRSATSGQAEPKAGQTVNWQGTVSSIPSPLPGHKEDVAIILPPRKDGGLYTGVVTFTASKGVSVQVWNELSGVSATQPLNTKEFGKLAISPYSNGKLIATSDVGSGDTSGSVPFAGSAVALTGKSPFIATYSVTAQAATGKVTNNLTSATALAGAGALGTLGGGGAAAPLTLGSSPATSGSGGGGSGGGGSGGGTTLGSSPATSGGGGSSDGGSSPATSSDGGS